ncbi:MAG: polysaccharide deacetylase family protein [Thermodesulfobacteriota bacterium]
MSIPVLMYHHVNNHVGDLVTITPQVFESQMRFLKESGFYTLTLDDLLSYIRGRHDIPKKSVVITFDDGYLDNYIHAFPILKQYNLKASIFIVVSWVEGASLKEQRNEHKVDIPTHRESKEFIRREKPYKSIINWKMIKEMQGSGLVEFYSHTMTHSRCDNILEGELKVELKASKDVLEDRLGRMSPYLCWPWGYFNGFGVDMAKEAGYKALFTTKPGVVRKGTDPFYIDRIVVKNKVGWFKRQIRIYTSPFASKLYLRIKGKV